MSMRKIILDKLLHPRECCHIHTTDINAAQPDDAHTHDFHELFWIEAGQGWHWINGEKRLLEPGILVLIRAPDAHAFSAAVSGSFRLVNVAFYCRAWEHLRARYFHGLPNLFGPKHISEREYKLTGAELAGLQRAARELASESRASFGIERFLLNLIFSLRSKSGMKDRSIPDWLKKACHDFTEPRHFIDGTQALARLAGRSPEHVSREVRRLLKKTPTEIVNDARMAYASSRLAGTDDKIVNIALDCGFENLGHFYRLFHAKFGHSPRAYRILQKRIVGTA